MERCRGRRSCGLFPEWLHARIPPILRNWPSPRSNGTRKFLFHLALPSRCSGITKGRVALPFGIQLHGSQVSKARLGAPFDRGGPVLLLGSSESCTLGGVEGNHG